LGEEGASDDFHRPLTQIGIDELEAEVEALKRLRLVPDVILTSPLVRAKQTAEIIAAGLGRKKMLVESKLLAPGCTLERLRELIEQHPEDCVMVVGHEPDFSRLIGSLIGPSGAAVEVKKAALAGVRIDGTIRPGSGLLVRLLPPRVLRLCGGHAVASDE